MVFRITMWMALATAVACAAAEPPPYWQVLEVDGSPYERGVQQGEAFAGKIRSLYTRMLTNSIIPSLNRERSTIAKVLMRYQAHQYDDGQFAERLLSESADSLRQWIPEPYLEEMHGVADGAGMSFEEILVLNTFFDTMLGFLSVQRFLTWVGGPSLASVRLDGVGTDGADNDDDGVVDEAGEGLLSPYEPSAHALWTEVPTDTHLILVLEDPDGVDPATVSLNLDGRVYEVGDPGVTARSLDDTQLEVTLAPTAGLPAASISTLQVRAGDLDIQSDPPPAHAHFMRDQWLVFATAGLDSRPRDIDNRARRDERLQPPCIAFAARGSATVDGALRAAHHFALLDAGTAHEHGAVIIHRPDDGIAHVTIGFTGVIWGTSGMNADGLVWTANPTDTLDNPLLGQIRDYLIAAELNGHGVPMGIMGRQVLSGGRDLADALAYLGSVEPTVGWNFLLADKSGAAAVLEIDGNTEGNPDNGHFPYGAEALDGDGNRLASTSADDLRTVAHFQMNTEDIDTEVLGFRVRPQRYWSPVWHRSLRAFFLLGDVLRERHGTIDGDAVTEILGLPDLVDHRDSMNAVVFEPVTGRVRVAMGRVPATDAGFVEIELGADFAGGEPSR